MTARLEQILIKRVRRGPMDSAQSARLVAGCGIDGNANQGGKRQVTLLETEIWQAALDALGAQLPAAARRANLVLSGFPLAKTRGKILAIGDCRIRIYGETKPCRLMNEILPGLEAALYPDWRGGAFGEIVEGGTMQVGDVPHWLSAAVVSTWQ